MVRENGIVLDLQGLHNARPIAANGTREEGALPAPTTAHSATGSPPGISGASTTPVPLGSWGSSPPSGLSGAHRPAGVATGLASTYSWCARGSCVGARVSRASDAGVPGVGCSLLALVEAVPGRVERCRASTRPRKAFLRTGCNGKPVQRAVRHANRRQPERNARQECHATARRVWCLFHFFSEGLCWGMGKDCVQGSPKSLKHDCCPVLARSKAFPEASTCEKGSHRRAS